MRRISDLALIGMVGLMVAGCKQGGTLRACNDPCEVHESAAPTQLSKHETYEYMKILPGTKGPGSHIDVNADGKNLKFTLDRDASHVLGQTESTVVRERPGGPGSAPVKTVISPEAKKILLERRLNAVDR